MGNVSAIHSVGDSLITYLKNAYPDALRAQFPCDFHLMSSGELGKAGDLSTTLSLFLYRVSMNEHVRSARWRNVRSESAGSLALDLHYLLTIWADNALAEHTILAWAMRQLFLHPVLDSSSLTPAGNWDPADAIQVVPSELNTETLMRVWEALHPSYRLSVSYVARVVHVDPDTTEASRPVVATRFGYEDSVS